MTGVGITDMDGVRTHTGPAIAALHVLGWSSYKCYLAEDMANDIRRYAANAAGMGLSEREIAQDVESLWPGNFHSVTVDIRDTRKGRIVEIMCLAASPRSTAPRRERAPAV